MEDTEPVHLLVVDVYEMPLSSLTVLVGEGRGTGGGGSRALNLRIMRPVHCQLHHAAIASDGVQRGPSRRYDT